MKHWHQCQRWRDIGYECPLGRFEEDEDDDDDDDGIPVPELIPIPARKSKPSAQEPAQIDLAVVAALLAVQEVLDPQSGVAAPRPDPVTVQVRGEFRLPPTTQPPLVTPPPQPPPLPRDGAGVFVTEDIPGMIPRVAALLEGTFALAGGAGGDLSEEERTLLASANEEAVVKTLPPSGLGGGRLAQLLNSPALDVMQVFGIALGVAGIGFVFNWSDRLRTLMSQRAFQVAPFEEGLSR